MVKQQPQTTIAPAAEASQEALVRGNKMGHMPVGRLLASVSVPIVISMLVQALYNVVDSIFVSRLGEDALAAVGLVFPVQNLMIAVSVGTGVGVASLLGRRLGEKNVASANRAATNGIFLMLVSWAVFALAGFFASGAYISSLAKPGPEHAAIASMGTTYMRIVTVGSLGIFMSIIFERLLQSTGRSMYSMIGQIAGALTNVILDPILIFGLLGFPAMGVAGAAYATVIGQFVGMGLNLLFNIRKNHDIHISFKGFRPNPKTIKHIYQVGAPSIVMQSIGSVMTFALNKILIGFGTTPVSVFSIYFTLQSFVIMPVIGVNNGMVPIVAFNYGARLSKRIEGTLKRCLIVNFCIMVAGTVLFWLLPAQLLSLFDAGPAMLEIGTRALRIISLSFPIAAISIVLSGFFQALGKGGYSLMMSLVRQLLVLIPLAWVLSLWHGLDIIWFAFVLAEIACIFVAIVLFLRVRRQIIKPMYSNPSA